MCDFFLKKVQVLFLQTRYHMKGNFNLENSLASLFYFSVSRISVSGLKI